MNKNKILNILLSSVLTGSLSIALLANSINAFAETNLDRIEKVKVFDIDFNNNKAINIVNNKEYTPSTSSANYVSSVKGNGYESNGSKLVIPFKDLGITSNDTVLTVSFLMKYGGSDTDFMPIGIAGSGEGDVGANDLWFYQGKFGFNTGKGDNIGISSPFVKNEYYSIIAEFNANDVSKNKLYINGVKQNISYLLNSTSYKNGWDENAIFSIGGFARNDVYTVSDKTIIDEVKIYKKSLTTEEVADLSKSHQIPELQADIVNNSYPKLLWATEMLPEDVLWSTSYEENDVRPGLTWSDKAWDGEEAFDFYGSQSFSTEDSYTGNYSLRVGDTRYGYNQKWEPITGETGGVSFSYFRDNIYGIPSGSKLSVSYRAKSETGAKYAFMPIITGNNTLEPYWSVAYENRLKPVVNNGKAVVVMEDFTLSNSAKWVTLNDVSWIPTFDNGRVKDVVLFYDFTGNQKYVKDNMVRITQVNKSTNQVLLNPRTNAPTLNIKSGTQLQERQTATVTSIAPAYIDSGGAVFRNDANFHYQTNTDWQLYNFNGIVYDEKDCYYNSETEGLYFTIRKATEGVAYIDDIKVGYSTKVRLYRNNSLIYEGYESQLNDTSAKDTTAPNSVSGITSTMEMINPSNSTRRINLTFKKSDDIGTSYDYQISAISKSGVETPKSKTTTQTVTSGLKGYSYVIDKSSSTIPDNTVDTTSTTITKDITDSGVYYLHIKAIDNAGNVSSITHYKIDIPTITATANPSEDMIKLNWSLSDLSNKIFKVYQKKEGSNEFQSISATNFENGKQVKVLNIYPNVNGSETFTTWDGETVTLPPSARLKGWMEEPTTENPKGYGKGIIEVIPVSQNDFNANPEKYLKDSNGNWLVNVIMVGTWDNNNNQTFNDVGIELIKEFISDGNGYLTGHDTTSNNNKKLLPYLNITLAGEGDVPSSYWVDTYRLGDNKVINTKKGLLTNYPWNIDKAVLNIPQTHTSYQWTYGDVWFDFEGVPNSVFPKYGNVEASDTTGKGTNNFYLTTYNNTAMIQTGHTNGLATEDEQKIIANTLFYLNQLSTDNFLDDYSGQDVKAPNKPTIKSAIYTNGKLDFYLNQSQDNGSEYKYYVKSENKNGEVAISNVVTQTITSGIKGYSYVVDRNPSTEPDNTVDITNISQKLSYSLSSGDTTLYIHVKAIDNVGNVSETLHYKIEDLTKPILNVTGNPTSWTANDVTLNISANDLESGLAYILLPNGTKVTTSTTSYTVSSNSTYTFKAYDNVGNETVVNVVVNKIDKELPTINYTKEFNSTKTNGYINISVIDNLSGFAKLELPNGDIVTSSTYKYPISNNGMYIFSVWDNVGNKSSIVVTINELNANNTPSGISRIEYKLSGATTQDWTTYTSPFYITNEGITTITARSYDIAGNLSSEVTSQVKIDKTKPINNGIEIKLK